MDAASVVGAWRLVSLEREVDGKPLESVSSVAREGRIFYTPDGYMSVLITRASRPSLSGDDLSSSPQAEQLAALPDSTAYCGTYEVRGDEVIHHVQVSLFPNWAGSDQRRVATLTGNRLVLSSTRTSVSGSQRTSRLTWERIGPAGA
jgi:hypothetical protein